MNNTIYQLQLTTWENDGDHYQTNSLIVTTEEDYNFYMHLINLFNTENMWNHTGYGNQDMSDFYLEDIIAEVMEKHPNISIALKNEWLAALASFDKATISKMHEILGNPVDYDYNFCRVVESINVTKIKPSDWIVTKKHQKAVFTGIDSITNKAMYFYDDFGKTDGQVDIFSRVWLKDMCEIKEVSYFSAGNEISVQVLNLHGR